MIEWFEKRPGELTAIGQDDPTMLLIPADNPDWVRVPDLPGIVGATQRCLGTFRAACPCGRHAATHYRLEGQVWCAECTVAGKFFWYRAPKQEG
jgi:hypothetical protein